jgi:hypothetical protein
MQGARPLGFLSSVAPSPGVLVMTAGFGLDKVCGADLAILESQTQPNNPAFTGVAKQGDRP